MVGGINLLADNFESFGCVLIVDPADAFVDIVAVFFVEGGAGAFDKGVFLGFDFVDEDIGGVDCAGVAFDADPGAFLLNERVAAVHAVAGVVVFVHGLSCLI